MKFNRPISSIVSVILAWVMSCGLLLLMPESSWANSDPPIELSPEIPANPLNLNPKDVGTFAWQTFVALNWPTDCPKSNGLDSNHKPRAWEFYNYPEEIFVPNGTKPVVHKNTGDPPPVIPPQCLPQGSKPAPMKLRLTEIADHPQFVQQKKGDLLDINGDLLGINGDLLGINMVLGLIYHLVLH